MAVSVVGTVRASCSSAEVGSDSRSVMSVRSVFSSIHAVQRAASMGIIIYVLSSPLKSYMLPRTMRSWRSKPR